jgi:poly-beta-hydroxyalkanoate depolymerase
MDLAVAQPRVLLVAPLSGPLRHVAAWTTVRTLLPEHDVYLTDWHNARDVSLDAAASASTNTSSTSVRFIETIGPART